MSLKVSIITANYNKAFFLTETIDSIRGQTYTDWEWIFIDDCSTDESLELIKKYVDERIRVFRMDKRNGANVCRNFGLKEVTGNYVVFVDADDVLTPTCLEVRVKKMQEDSTLQMCVFAMGIFHRSIGDDDHIWKPRTTNALVDFFQHYLPWSILQPIWKKEVLLEVNGFDEKFDRLQDVEFHTRLLLHGDLKFKQFPEVIDCYYRVGDDRRSANTYDYNMPRVKASLQYYSKFYDKAKERKLSSKLLGTIYQTYHQCIFHTRKDKMSKQHFNDLESKLMDNNILRLNGFKQFMFSLSRSYNFYFPRIPGVNYLLSRIITC